MNTSPSPRLGGLRRRSRILVLVLLTILATPVVVVAVSPTTTGTLTHREAAGSDATFIEILGIDVHVTHAAHQPSPNSAASFDVVPPPLIVLLHGFGASTGTWDATMQHLSELGTVVAYDRPGFGFTQRPLDDHLSRLVQAHEVDPYGNDGQIAIIDALVTRFSQGGPLVLIGHSAGGSLAVEYALARPGHADLLVLVAPALLTTGGINPTVQGWLSTAPLERAAPVLMRWAARSSDRLLERSWSDPNLVPDQVRDRFRQPQAVIDWERGLWRYINASSPTDAAEGLGQLLTPALVIAGNIDRVVPATDARRVAEGLTNSRLVLIPGAGHLPHEEDPVRFMEHLTSSWPLSESRGTIPDLPDRQRPH